MRAIKFERPDSAASEKTRGAVAIEMALVLPILIMLAFGIIEFGRMYNAKITLANAAREAAREWVITGDETLVTAIVTNLETTLMTDTVLIDVLDECGLVPPRVVVTASSDLDFNIPLVSSGTFNLEETVVMRCNG